MTRYGPEPQQMTPVGCLDRWPPVTGRGKRGYLIGPPALAPHQIEKRVQLAAIAGQKETEGSPLAEWKRRLPQPQEVTGGSELSSRALHQHANPFHQLTGGRFVNIDAERDKVGIFGSSVNIRTLITRHVSQTRAGVAMPHQGD
jgi:hypothetical protein